MSELKRSSPYDTKYTKGMTRKDPVIGEYSVMNPIEGKESIICIEKLYNDKDSLIKDIEQKKRRMLGKHEYLLNVLDYSVIVEKSLCSSFFILKTFIEYPYKSLKQEILEKKSKSSGQDSFNLEELTYLLYHQVLANSFLQEKQSNAVHGDICPNTIFLNEKAEFKLAFRNQELLSAERLQSEKLIKGEPVYLSPIVYSAVKKRSFDKLKHNPHKSDIFSLGLTILEAGLMRSIQSIYTGREEIDINILESFLNEFEQRYSENPLLFTSIRKMLDFKEEERPDFISMKQALPEFQTIVDYFYKLKNGQRTSHTAF